LFSAKKKKAVSTPYHCMPSPKTKTLPQTNLRNKDIPLIPPKLLKEKVCFDEHCSDPFFFLINMPKG
jgi:hypothetical protein